MYAFGVKKVTSVFTDEGKLTSICDDEDEEGEREEKVNKVSVLKCT